MMPLSKYINMHFAALSPTDNHTIMDVPRMQEAQD